MEEHTQQREGPPRPWRVVVKFQDDLFEHQGHGWGVEQYQDGLEHYLMEYQLAPWEKFAARFPGITLERQYITLSPEAIVEQTYRAQKHDPDYQPPNFLTYFVIDVTPDTDPRAVADAIADWDIVETAYVASPPAPPPAGNYVPYQYYRDSGPRGTGARALWDTVPPVPGCDGAGVRFAVLEYGWKLDHEDLVDEDGDVLVHLLPGSHNDVQYIVHGTSTLGVLFGQDNDRGVLGFAPAAEAYAVSQMRNSESAAPTYNLPDAIQVACEHLGAGDVLILQAQVWNDSLSYTLPVEVETANYHEIEKATALGITVVEAAGNGGRDLDVELPDRDPGAILVGAAHSEHAHAPLDTSNQGARVHCYAWGNRVTSTACQWTSPHWEDTYTWNFGGTSSATAIVGGIAVVVQAVKRRENPGPGFSPQELRDILKNPATGTEAAPPGRVGVMPDVRRVLEDQGLPH